jgi:Family of unknown function (DUF6090)
MIKFFRRIRFDLMEKNKTGKYLKYAIGEIVLVVIGILIALGINNWNSERNEKLKYQKQLAYVVQNIKSDSIQLRQLKQSRLLAKNVASSLMKELNYKNIKEPDKFINSFLILTGEMKFVSNLDKQIKNQFENYQNTEIHELLDDYQKIVGGIEFREFRHNEFSENLEAELWNNGFFRKVGTTYKNDEGIKQYYSNFKNLDLGEIGIYDDETLYALCLRAELGFSWLLTEYDLLIQKGFKTNQMINKFINK